MAQLQEGALKRHDDIELIVSFVKSFVKDIINKGYLTYAYDDDVEKTEVFVGVEYPIYAQNVKLIFLVRDMAPSYTEPLIGSNYDTGMTLSTLEHKKVNMQYTTFMIMIYARTRYDSKYFATYLSSYLAYYEDDIRKKMSIQDFMRRNISQTIPSYVTSFGNLFVTMVSISMSKLEAWSTELQPGSSEVTTVTKEGIHSIDETTEQKDGYIDVQK